MAPNDLTVEILRDIRAEIRLTRSDLSTHIDVTREGFARTNDRLDRVVQEQIRHSTAIVGVEHRLGGVEHRLGNVEHRLGNVEHRLGNVEGRLGNVEQEVRLLGGRIDNVLVGPMGQLVRDHEERIQRLEGQPSPAGA